MRETGGSTTACTKIRHSFFLNACTYDGWRKPQRRVLHSHPCWCHVVGVRSMQKIKAGPYFQLLYARVCTLWCVMVYTVLIVRVLYPAPLSKILCCVDAGCEGEDGCFGKIHFCLIFLSHYISVASPKEGTSEL